MTQVDDVRTGTTGAPSDLVGGVERHLVALETLLASARSVPMSSTVMIDRGTMKTVIQRIRASLPAEIVAAKDVIAGSDAKVGEMIAEAEDRRRLLIARSKVVEAAEVRAAEILAEAEQSATEIRSGADDYLDRQLGLFEVALEKVRAEVQRGRAELRPSPPEPPAFEEPSERALEG